MGEVYRARDTRLERTVAIKILPPHLSGSPEARQRFEREARTISSLNHPNICTLHDVGNEGETKIGPPKTLFQTGIRHSIPTEFYEVARDGRFLMVNSIMESTAPVVLVTNWDAELKR